ncbi:MAG TPA: AAA family ATPase [Gemmatimonadaceae bacterium]|nr:AAA family ATPase [Gemmatimonadaceae bacterium]
MATLHLICGLPGAGKTTLALELEQRVRAIRLTPDDWITGLLGPHPPQEALDAARDPTEALQWELATRLLALGIDVILDFGFWSRDERELYRARASALGADSIVHFVDEPLDVLHARLIARQRDRPPNTFVVTPEQLDHWSTLFQRPNADELIPRSGS